MPVNDLEVRTTNQPIIMSFIVKMFGIKASYQSSNSYKEHQCHFGICKEGNGATPN